MATDATFMEYIAEQVAGAGTVTYRKMFGEYALYNDGKVVALVCDNRLFIKPTGAGRRFIGTVVEGCAYPGAKPSFLIEDKLDDSDWLGELVRITAAELPVPVKKSTKKKTATSKPPLHRK